MKRLSLLRPSLEPLLPRAGRSHGPSSAVFVRAATTSPVAGTHHRRWHPINPQKHGYATTATTAEPAALSRTGLYDLHVRNGGKMVPFAGYSMPLQYSDLSVGDSHRWTREKASLFDVGHMVQHRFAGPSAVDLLSRITPSSVSALAPFRSTLSCLLHPGTGGIVDDCVVTRLGRDDFYVVTNAACRDKDLRYISAQIAALGGPPPPSLEWTVLDGWGLIALQGPLSAEILETALAPHSTIDLAALYFGQCAEAAPRPSSRPPSLPPLLVSRGGYTGEDGFEIRVPPRAVAAVAELLLASAGPGRLRLAGLGARDSLRLEAGMCLYGHDLDDSVTPVEAGLAWVVGRDRRADAAAAFHGSDVILAQLRPARDGGAGVRRRRVGLVVEGAPAREGAELLLPGEGAGGAAAVGRVTSGCPSPTLGKNIAMAYVESGLHRPGTRLDVLVRGKRRAAEVVRMPFVPTRFRKAEPAAPTTVAAAG